MHGKSIAKTTLIIFPKTTITYLMKVKAFLLSIFLLVATVFSVSLFAQEATTPGNNTELMAQGRVRSCLKPSYITTPSEKGVVQKLKIRLQGTCDSPAGCSCVTYHGLNGAVANIDEVAGCEQHADERLGQMSAKEIAKKKAAGKCNSKQTSKRSGKNCGDCSCLAEDKAVSCGHQKADLKNPILANLKPETKACNIIENKLAGKNGNALAQNQVLGETTILPPGPVDIVVEETTYRHTAHDFYTVGELPTTVAAQGLGQGGNTGDGSDDTQKLGVLEFFSQKLETKIENLETNCKSIAWDPYGRVFDAQSLEPISDVEVTMIDALTNEPAVQEFNFNNDFTGEDGVFNILVEREGNYGLTAAPRSDHSFVANSKLSPYWPKIYSDLYSPGVFFVEKAGVATHHDIALVSNGAPYRSAVAEMVPGTLKSENMGDQMVYRGRQTFPMAKVCLVNSETKRVVGQCVSANNIGSFTIVVAKSEVPQVRLDIKAEKVDLNDPNLYKKDQKVETLHVNSLISPDDSDKVYSFEPVLSHVEGFVYDSKGQVIPKAGVRVFVLANDQLFFETKADDSGFFTIYTENLPYVEYYFEFTNPVTGEKVKKTASTFVRDNKSYLASKDINLITATKSNQPVVNPATGKLNDIADTTGAKAGGGDAGGATSNFIGTNLILIIFILILLLGAAMGMVIYIKRQKN